MHKLFLGLILFLSHEVKAQSTVDSLLNSDDYILNAISHRKGIYKTFEEFKYNNPSITENYVFEKNKLWLTDANARKVKKVNRKDIWGFCDGAKTFVSWNTYNEVLDKGRYCYFKEKGIRIISIGHGFPLFFVPFPLPYTDELIINFNTGKTYILSKKLLKVILKTDDPDLLTEFMGQQRKGKKLHEYLIKYNERNVARIK